MSQQKNWRRIEPLGDAEPEKLRVVRSRRTIYMHQAPLHPPARVMSRWWRRVLEILGHTGQSGPRAV